MYVYDNPRITAGMTVDGLTKAFTEAHARNWHPLTTISHMVDCQLFGLDPGWHHFVNVLLHTATVLLLFLALRAMTGAWWRSAFVTALFAIHPLRAESVAWIAERKDVLSGLFFMLTLIAYSHYARRRSFQRYIWVVIAFALGLMAKPMLVTLPLLLLLLDYWPLRSVTGTVAAPRPRSLVYEKIPLLILSAASSAVTLITQGSTITYGNKVPLVARCGNAILSYTVYLQQFVWPAKLTPFYAYSGEMSSRFQIAIDLALLIAITVTAVVLRRRFPYIFVGWLWYVIALLPVIGLLQVGLQGHADRYTYLPQIGLSIAIGWAGGEIAQLIPRYRVALVSSAVILIGLLTWCGRLQTSYWKNTQTLWEHTLAVDPRNELANYYMGQTLEATGQLNEAIAHFNTLLDSHRENATAHYAISSAIVRTRLGNIFAEQGHADAALAEYRQAIAFDGTLADAHSNAAAMLLRLGDLSGAIAELEKAVIIPPEDAASHIRLGSLLLQAGRAELAAQHYSRALELEPAEGDARAGLGRCSRIIAKFNEQKVSTQ
jgi:Flp pilus assembly protein TadD